MRPCLWRYQKQGMDSISVQTRCTSITYRVSTSFHPFACPSSRTLCSSPGSSHLCRAKSQSCFSCHSHRHEVSILTTPIEISVCFANTCQNFDRRSGMITLLTAGSPTNGSPWRILTTRPSIIRSSMSLFLMPCFRICLPKTFLHLSR